MYYRSEPSGFPPDALCKGTMRIAILSDKLVVSGGAERYLANMIRGLLDAGDEVDLYTTKVAFDRELLERDGLSVHRLDLSRCPRKLRAGPFERYLKRRLRGERYDMVLGMAAPYSPDIAVCFGTFLGDMLAHKRRLLNPLNWVRVAYERKKYRGARVVAVRSRIQRDELRRLFGVADEKCRVLPPPIVGFDAPTADADEVRRRYRLDAGLKYFIFVSNSHRRKGLDTAVRAFDLLGRDDCRVLVAGAGRRRFADRPYVRWLGYVEGLAELYPVCAAAVLPARYEPFGQTVAEAVLSGLPVFVSDRVGAADVLDKRMGRVTPCNDADALAAALREFLERPFRVPEECVAELRDRLSLGRHISELKNLPNPRLKPRLNP